MYRRNDYNMDSRGNGMDSRENGGGFMAPEEYRRNRYRQSAFENGEVRQAPSGGNPIADKEETYGGRDMNPPVKKALKQPILLFQTVVCLIAAIAVFALKGIGGSVYETVKEYYLDYFTSSDIIEDFFPENQIIVPNQNNNTPSAQPTEETVTEEEESDFENSQYLETSETEDGTDSAPSEDAAEDAGANE